MKDGVVPGTVRGVNPNPDRTGDDAMQSFVSRHRHRMAAIRSYEPLAGVAAGARVIRKFSKTHRQQVTPRGREQIAAILAARADGVEKLVEAA
jgi:hypothetical protein